MLIELKTIKSAHPCYMKLIFILQQTSSRNNDFFQICVMSSEKIYWKSWHGRIVIMEEKKFWWQSYWKHKLADNTYQVKEENKFWKIVQNTTYYQLINCIVISIPIFSTTFTLALFKPVISQKNNKWCYLALSYFLPSYFRLCNQ